MTTDRAARVCLWGAAGYGLGGVLMVVLVTLSTGNRGLLREGAALLVLGAVAVAGLRITRAE